jgi:hypothetical protein
MTEPLYQNGIIWAQLREIRQSGDRSPLGAKEITKQNSCGIRSSNQANTEHSKPITLAIVGGPHLFHLIF